MSVRPSGEPLHLLTPKVLHIFDRSLWLFPFMTTRSTELEATAKNANVSVPQRTAFLAMLLEEHNSNAARSQLKDLWTKWIGENYKDEDVIDVDDVNGASNDVAKRAPTPTGD